MTQQDYDRPRPIHWPLTLALQKEANVLVRDRPTLSTGKQNLGRSGYVIGVIGK